jgi:hypothetical protein
MKQHWIFIAAGAAFSPMGFAASLQDYYCNPTPCYEYAPTPCIDCECFIPKYLLLQGCDTFVSVDVLYWFAREKNLYYAVDGTMVSTGTERAPADTELFLFGYVADKYKTLETKWAPGVRVGAGWSSECNDWDAEISWTYYHNEKKNSTSVPPFAFQNRSPPMLMAMPGPGQSALLNPWADQSALFPITAANPPNSSRVVFFPRIDAKWTLTLNSIDLDIGRTFWVRECFTFRPYAGIRGAWTRTQFETKSLYINTVSGSSGATALQTATDLTAINRFTDHFWGVGMHVGIEPTWIFCCNWSLFADFNAALIYGKARSKKREDYQGSVLTTPATSAPNGFVNYDHDPSLSFFSMQPIFDLGMGIRWEQSWCCERFYSAIALSWEQSIWPESNFRESNFGLNAQGDGGQQMESLAVGFVGQDSTLFYGGPVLRVRFDF